MHDINDNFDINLSEISKIEGAASLEIKVRNKKIEDFRFGISEWKRFYTQAIKGKPLAAIPQLVARICGTCSNAHLLCAIKAAENALGIIPSVQTKLLRQLIYNGLLIRDHALHLYIFSLPDLFGKNSILDFDENDPIQKQFLEDAFAVKDVGNQLSIVVGGRSVHAPYPSIGGFLKLPKLEEIKNLKQKLLDIRPKILKVIKIFYDSSFSFIPQTKITYNALVSKNFSFLEGENDLAGQLEAVIIPYSHARGFKLNGNLMMVGALARLNLSKSNLHPKTIESANEYLKIFPSDNLFHNNLAQAIEILHIVDYSIDIIADINLINPEILPKINQKETIGVGAIEAPRGTLYYKLEINPDGTVKRGEIVVPTGQNQVLMEKAGCELTQTLLEKNASKELIIMELERLIRAFDPCMSCASHFLKVKWR